MEFLIWKLELGDIDWMFLRNKLAVGALAKRALADMASALQVPNKRPRAGLGSPKQRSRSRLQNRIPYLLAILQYSPHIRHFQHFLTFSTREKSCSLKEM